MTHPAESISTPCTNHVITMRLTRRDLVTIYRDAMKASIGGRSQIRKTDDRRKHLSEDQIVGLVGNYALALWRDGDERAYLDMRHSQNRFPTKGDGGYDLPRCRIDIKTSMMRRSQDPMTYNLPVRPRERHKGWVYGLALTESFSIQGLKANPLITVHLVGWAREDELPENANGVGKLEGAFVIPATKLHAFPPLVYEKTNR